MNQSRGARFKVKDKIRLRQALGLESHNLLLIKGEGTVARIQLLSTFSSQYYQLHNHKIQKSNLKLTYHAVSVPSFLRNPQISHWQKNNKKKKNK